MNFLDDGCVTSLSSTKNGASRPITYLYSPAYNLICTPQFHRSTDTLTIYIRSLRGLLNSSRVFIGSKQFVYLFFELNGLGLQLVLLVRQIKHFPLEVIFRLGPILNLTLQFSSLLF